MSRASSLMVMSILMLFWKTMAAGLLPSLVLSDESMKKKRRTCPTCTTSQYITGSLECKADVVM